MQKGQTQNTEIFAPFHAACCEGRSLLRAWGQERSREEWTWLKIALAETSLGQAKENMEEQQELVPWSRTPLSHIWDPPRSISSPYRYSSLLMYFPFTN